MSDRDSDAEPTEEAGHDLSSAEVTDKYRVAGDIVNQALQEVVNGCVVGADVAELCAAGDNVIITEVSKIYTKKINGKKMDKGVAFPTCISINEICGHFSPLLSETRKLEPGDVIKIDMGCHIDGYICVGGHTVILSDSEEKITGRKAEVMKAVWTAAEVALRKIHVGASALEVTRCIELAAKEFNCAPVQGVRSHQMKRHIIDGNQCFAGKISSDERMEDFEFGLNEVYGVDIVLSTGDGRARESDVRTTVFKRAVETNYALKTPLARHFISEVNKKFAILPFTLRAVEDQRACRVGVSECMRHDLLHPYSVFTEKKGEIVAQYKFTVLLLPGGTKKATGLPFHQLPMLELIHGVMNEELKKILSTSADPRRRRKKARDELKKAQAAAQEGDEKETDNEKKEDSA